MRVLVLTNDLILISAIEALLKSARIRHVVLDQHMSSVEGSLGMLPRRILVDDDQHFTAQDLLAEAGFGDALATE